ncbi:exo-alpha-sialidase [Sphingomonas sp. ABOLF]|nr:exo-alpha-sialidase [Sphingomonas sp. ABOLF]
MASWRNEARMFTIIVRGADLTGISVRQQVRDAPDTPGDPIIALETVTDASAEGLQLVGVTIEDGLPISTIVGRYSKATMRDSLPYGSEPGQDYRLSHAIQIDGVTRLYGDWWARATPIDSDNAEMDGGSTFQFSAAPAVQSGATLTIAEGEVLEIVLDGTAEQAAMLKRAQDVIDAVDQLKSETADLVDEAGNQAAAARGATLEAAGYAEALSLIKVDVPGYAFALATDRLDLPLLIPDDFSQLLLGGRDIANQVTIATYETTTDRNVIMDPAGRIVSLGGSTGGSGNVDQFLLDADRFAGTAYERIRIIPAVLSSTNASVPEADRGAAANRIPGFALSPTGLGMLVWEGRTGGDFDPKNIMYRLGQVQWINGSWTFVWLGPARILAHDRGGWGADGLGENTLGNAVPAWDRVDGCFRMIMYWRRGDVPNGDNNTSPANGAETTSRIYGVLVRPDWSITDWDGNAFAPGSGRAAMTDLTAGKPQSWGSGSPGPGKGLCTRAGECWFAMHGWDEGDGAINPRRVALSRLNRTTRRLELIAITPGTYKPNESGIAEDADGNIIIDSRSLGEDARIVNVWLTQEGAWLATARDATRRDPQAAGDIVAITHAGSTPYPRPHRMVSVNNVTKFGSGGANGGAGERRGLTAHLSLTGRAGAWKAKRRIYDQITVAQQESGLDGNVVLETVDAWGSPLAAPAQRKLYTGYPVADQYRDLTLVVHEGQMLAPDGAAVSGIAIALVPFAQYFVESN